MVQLVRLCGLVALGTGVLSWFVYSSPLLLHIFIGGLLVSALCVLAVQSRVSVTRQTALAVAVAVVIPLLGLLELKPSLGEFQWTLQWLHPAAGIGGMGLAEVLAKRIRLA
jgi:hypothetical protein